MMQDLVAACMRAKYAPWSLDVWDIYLLELDAQWQVQVALARSVYR